MIDGIASSNLDSGTNPLTHTDMKYLLTLTEEQLIELREIINDNLGEETKYFYTKIYIFLKPIVGFMPTRVDRVSDDIHVYMVSNDD